MQPMIQMLDGYIIERYPSFPNLLAYAWPDPDGDDPEADEYIYNLTQRELFMFIVHDGVVEATVHSLLPEELQPGSPPDDALAWVTTKSDVNGLHGKLKIVAETFHAVDPVKCKTLCTMIENWS